MDNDKPTPKENAMTSRVSRESPICVGLLAYVRFAREMDVQLRRLVACWIHTATPIARGMWQDPPEERPRRR
jgi:hypothetical protein